MSAFLSRWFLPWSASDSTLRRDSIATLLARICWVGMEFMVSLLLARLLGLAGYGAYAFAMSVAALLSGPASAGFDRLLIREVAVQNSAGRWSRLRGLLQIGTRVSLTCSALLAAAILIVAPSLANGHDTDAVAALRNAALLLPLVAFSRQRQAALQGLGRVALGQVPEMLLLPLTVLALIAGNFALEAVPWSGQSATAMQLIAATVSGIVGALLLRRALPGAVRQAQPDYATRAWLSAAAPLLFLVLTNMALNHMDTVMLGALRSTSEAGAYRAASQVAALVVFPMTAINMAAAPRLAALFATGDRAGMQRIAAQAVRVGASLGFAIAVAVWLAGRPLLGLFGADFGQAYLPLMMLTGAYVFNTMAGTAGYLLIMTQHARVAATLFGVAVIIGLCSQAMLIPQWGAIGAALGTSLALIVLSLGLVLAAAWRTGIRAGLWHA